MTQYIARWASGYEVRWRALTWAEYRQFKQRALLRPIGVDSDIYRAVLLDGPPVERCPAGIASYIAKHALAGNPFSGRYEDVAQALVAKREALERNYLLSAKAMVAHLFHVSFEEIDKWDADVFFTRLAQAEFIAGKQLQPADPKAAKSQDPNQKRPKRPLTAAQSMVVNRVNDSRT